jgi:uncharacterized Zn-finger protein
MATSYTGFIGTGLIGGPAVPKDQACPQFRNDRGVQEIRIGVREFECIGETPPQDHPHIYLDMGQEFRILCPYCGTMYCLDLSFQRLEAQPQESLFRGH